MPHKPRIRWKNYEVFWCDLCRCASIACHDKKCQGTSCNAGGCKKCHEDFNEFMKVYKKWKVTDFPINKRQTKESKLLDMIFGKTK